MTKFGIAKQTVFGVHTTTDLSGFGVLEMQKNHWHRCLSLNMSCAKSQCMGDGQKAFRSRAKNASFKHIISPKDTRK